MARWKYFSWNDLVHTNFRLGLLGGSYVTGISNFEKDFDSSRRSNQFLNLLIPEITVSPAKEALFRLFMRCNPVSRIYGLINGESGASNYICGGIRFSAF
jgi:hypothetical protein